MADKLNMKKIIAILEAREGSLEKLNDFVKRVNNQGLTFTEPVEIETLEKIDIAELLRVIPDVIESEQAERRLRQAVDLVTPMVVDVIDFV